MKAFYIVHGVVQGVGYRAHVRAAAQKHGISGMVRNRRDGSVEIFAQGSTDKMNAFEKEVSVSVRSGPQVFHVEKFMEGSEGFIDFGNRERFSIEKTE
ncbi:MAG: acylphosphatase [Candidatus Marsarchaeota archaeon]|nr:acylphosphatase [Candidatus Marsarchaeota archaeon]